MSTGQANIPCKTYRDWKSEPGLCANCAWPKDAHDWRESAQASCNCVIGAFTKPTVVTEEWKNCPVHGAAPARELPAEQTFEKWLEHKDYLRDDAIARRYAWEAWQAAALAVRQADQQFAAQLESNIKFLNERVASLTAERDALPRGFVNLYSIIEGKECDPIVGIGMATSAVDRLKLAKERAEAALREAREVLRYVLPFFGNADSETVRLAEKRIIAALKGEDVT